MANNRFSVLNAALLLAIATSSVSASQISISSLPVMSSPVLVADGATPYTVTLTASGVAGYDDIRSIRVLFNFTESGSDPTKGRGYLAWGQADSDITNYGGTWVFADATGGGRWAYRIGTNEVNFGTNLTGILDVARGSKCAFVGPHITLHDIGVPALIIQELGGVLRILRYRGGDDVESWNDVESRFAGLDLRSATPRFRVIIADCDATVDRLVSAMQTTGVR